MQFARILISTVAAATMLTIGAGQALARHNVYHPRTAAAAAQQTYGAPVRNPSGGLIGQPQNFPTPMAANSGSGGAPQNFPKNPAYHRDTSHSIER
jgi:hypothetical protein